MAITSERPTAVSINHQKDFPEAKWDNYIAPKSATRWSTNEWSYWKVIIYLLTGLLYYRITCFESSERQKNKATISCFSKYVPSFCSGSTGLLKIILDQTQLSPTRVGKQKEPLKSTPVPWFYPFLTAKHLLCPGLKPQEAMSHPGYSRTHVKSEWKVRARDRLLCFWEPGDTYTTLEDSRP